MSTAAYDIGDVVRMKATFTSTAGTVQNPSAVKLVYTTPSGTDTVVTTTGFTHASTGVYYKDVVVTEAGRWVYQFTSTGTGAAAGGDAFAVRPNLASTST